MARFSYEAYQKDGASVTGSVDALDELQALEIISARGLTPADVRLGSERGPWWTRELSLSGRSSVKPKDLEAFFEGFATLLSAQLPLPRALAFCEAQSRNHELKQGLSELRGDIENGQTLTAALASQTNVIPERLQGILRLGESSNTLPQAVTRAAAVLKSEAATRNELRSALVYPIILLIMSLLVLALIIFYLAPTLAPVFATAGSAPPPVLRVMIGLQTTLTAHPLIAIGSLAVCLLVLVVFRGMVARVLAVPLSFLPAFRNYQRNRETLRFCQTLDLMLIAGATLPEALHAAEDATPSDAWQEAISTARLEVEAGGTLSSSLEGFSNFNPMAMSLIKAGEESDAMSKMLSSATGQLEKDTQTTLQQALRLLTPALTLIIGGLVGFLIISTISAILDLNDIAF